MSRHPSKSVVIVDTEAYELANIALLNTVERFQPDEVVIFSDQPLRWRNYSIIEIPAIQTLADYNRIVTRGLAEHLCTDFALVIQFDGFAMNQAAWSDEFLDYDYIGAPWPPDLFPSIGATVGNGGFSLRSRRLIEAVSDEIDLVGYEIAEDISVCVDLRRTLMSKHRVRFAPLDVAGRFSVELDNSYHPAPFGFHGLHILPSIYRSNPRFLIDHLPRRCLLEGSAKLKQLRFGFNALPLEAQAALDHEILVNLPEIGDVDSSGLRTP